jgi:formylglycine-generating enzyme required for sulfatase activity
MKLLLCLCFALGAALLGAPAWSQQQDARVALVIGNAYPEATPPLAASVGDARALAAELRRHGFTVDLKENLNKQQMQDAIAAFIGSIRNGGIALFYFSGYGIQADRRSFLIPVNADIWREAEVKREGVSIDNVLAEMHRKEAKVKILIVDGAHRNRFEERFRANPAGLSAIDTPAGTLTLYSAAPDKLINDGSGASSVFKSELIKQLRDADLTAEAAFNRVRIGVSRATNSEQVPSVSSTLVEEFRFGPAIDACAAAADDWRRAEASRSLAAFEDHLARFPDCEFAGRARARIDELRKKTTAAAPPVAPAQPPPPAQPAVGVTPSTGTVPLSAERERELKPKDTFKECAACPEMIVVPAGSFVMGSRADEKGHLDNEGPQHPVKIGKSFAVGEFHITVDQFATFVAETRYDAGSKCYVFEEGRKMDEKRGRFWRNPGFAQTGAHPAVCLSWNDAKAYTVWLSRQTGRTYRLLTEAEWEYAARAGSTTRYFFGDDEKDACRYANGADQTAKSTIPEAKSWAVAPCSDGYAYTSPVGSLLPNAFGLHDMHGNAYQWVEDCWHADYTEAPADGTARTSAGCSDRVLRGGAYWTPPSGLRAAKRDWSRADSRYGYVGFRVARTLE